MEREGRGGVFFSYESMKIAFVLSLSGGKYFFGVAPLNIFIRRVSGKFPWSNRVSEYKMADDHPAYSLIVNTYVGLRYVVVPVSGSLRRDGRPLMHFVTCTWIIHVESRTNICGSLPRVGCQMSSLHPLVTWDGFPSRGKRKFVLSLRKHFFDKVKTEQLSR